MYYVFLEIIPFWIFIIDILIILNTGFYERGTLISDKKLIVKNYYKSHLLLDLISLGPSLFNIYTKFTQILFLLRIFKLRNLTKKMNEYLQLPEYTSGFIKLLSLFFNIIYLAHLCGCFMHYLAQREIELGFETTWLHKNRINNELIYIRYVNSLYYCVLTMLTVGFIDTDSHTEKAFSIIVDLILSGTFAYAIGSMGIILQDMIKNENELKYYI